MHVTAKFKVLSGIRILHQANIMYHEIHSVPSILPSISDLSDFIIRDCYEKITHVGNTS